VVNDAGCAIIGQTADLAPADRRLYGIRDVTATVESIPLITASILSKKLAAGLDCLVMDVKTGSGAFAAGRDMARALARSIVSVANGAGVKTAALITDMDQVLGTTAGNAVEVREAVGALAHPRGAEPRLIEVTLALCATLLRLGGVHATDEEARAAAGEALTSGAAAERFGAMSRALGGPADIVDDPDRHLPRAPHALEVFPEEAGHVRAIAVRDVGVAVLELGGGRLREDQGIDHAVGLVDVAGLGEEVGHGARPLAVVHAADAAAAERAAARLREAFTVGDAPDALPVLTEAVV
jgi:thymidine phosphorylase